MDRLKFTESDKKKHQEKAHSMMILNDIGKKSCEKHIELLFSG
jgi:hypothetical protein